MKITLMDRGRIERTIRRMAYQISEKVKEKKICLIGLNERGHAVAEELYGRLRNAAENEVALYRLDVTGNGAVPEGLPEPGCADSVMLLVDDVIFTGKTMFSAFQKLVDSPDRIVYTAVLVDRGNRNLPIASEFVGMDIPTKPREHVEVTLKDGQASEVYLYRE